jgi:glycosyltransferase involved in cell wall biosynthesis
MSLVSIITPTYNSSKYIDKTIESILSQTYQNWELIITDDFSTDETVSIVNSYIKTDSRIKLYELKNNSGSALARNNSIKFSKGFYIAFCDSDDTWDSHKLENHIKFHQEKNALFSFTNISIANDKGLIILKRQSIIKYKVNYNGLISNEDLLTNSFQLYNNASLFYCIIQVIIIIFIAAKKIVMAYIPVIIFAFLKIILLYVYSDSLLNLTIPKIHLFSLLLSSSISLIMFKKYIYDK